MKLLHGLHGSKQNRKQGSVSKQRNVHTSKADEETAGSAFMIFGSQPACNVDSLFYTNSGSVESTLRAGSGGGYRKLAARSVVFHGWHQPAWERTEVSEKRLLPACEAQRAFTSGARSQNLLAKECC